jgi:hypothetical protein
VLFEKDLVEDLAMSCKLVVPWFGEGRKGGLPYFDLSENTWWRRCNQGLCGNLALIAQRILWSLPCQILHRPVQSILRQVRQLLSASSRDIISSKLPILLI